MQNMLNPDIINLNLRGVKKHELERCIKKR